MSDPRISEAEARRLWERAAELQAQAMHQLEARARERREARTAPADDPFPEDGFALEEVREAAQEAGIGADFVDRALVELEHDRRGLSTPPDRVDRMADRLLDAPTGSLVVQRTLAGDGKALLAALDRVLTGPGYGLTLVDLEGEDPLQGGVLSFRVPSYMGMSGKDFAYRASWLWSDTLLVTIRPAQSASDPERTETPDPAPDPASTAAPPEPTRWNVELRIPLRKGRRVNAWGSVFTAGTTGGLGGAMGVAAGLGLAGLAALPAVVAGAVVVGAAGAGLAGSSWGGLALYRAGWRHGAKQMRVLLDETLNQVALHLRTGGAFSPPTKDGSGKDAASGALLAPWIYSG
ncbi:MAG: hypothetical protein EA350_15610 [Gemmatimonadales bacterium]|nr:MAG: hypothetical protein EA350_15610 [Gemmatimonadales bacterium]